MTFRTATELSALASQPGQYKVAPNLSLKVAKNREPFWLCVYILNGKRRSLSLGPYPALKLGAALKKVDAIRVQVDQGIDPLAEKQQMRQANLAVKPKLPTFGQAIRGYYTEHASERRASTIASVWDLHLKRLEPLNEVAFTAIDRATVIDFLKPFWANGRISTGTQVRSFAERCWFYGQAEGWVDDNAICPWLWLALKARFRKLPDEQNFPAVPYQRLPPVIDRFGTLRTLNELSMAATALEFSILTASRPGEVVGLPWSELDLCTRVWNLPSARDKEGADRITPLSDRAIACIEYARGLAKGGESPYVFRGYARVRRVGRGLCRETLTNTLRRHVLPIDKAATTHGTARASFKTWALEVTDFPSEIVELCLGHGIKGVAGAYVRGDAIAKRRQVFQDWADYLANPGAPAGFDAHETVTNRSNAL